MVEFEPDEESVSRARELSSRFVRDLRRVSEEAAPREVRKELFSETRCAEQAGEAPINDVADNMQQMAGEFAMARRWDGKILCSKLDDGGIAPISMRCTFGGPMWPAYDIEDWIEYWERHVPFPPMKEWWKAVGPFARREEGVVVTDLGEATDGVERGLIGFLSHRFAGMKKWRGWTRGITNQLFGRSERPPAGGGWAGGGPFPPPATGPGGGLQVQVSCLTHGLRIHVAPAYFISWVFFGSPTTPVSSYVLPGRYVFAGDGPMLPRLTQDHGVFSIPPTYYPALTRF